MPQLTPPSVDEIERSLSILEDLQSVAIGPTPQLNAVLGTVRLIKVTTWGEPSFEEEVMRDKTYECRSCGEPTDSELRAELNGRCRECFTELTTGQVPKVTGPQYQSHASHLTPRQRPGLGKTGG